MKLSGFKLCFFGLVVHSLAYGGVFQFSLLGFPKEERNCHAQTASVAQKFEEGTHTKVVHVECVSERLTGYDFLIEYEASQELEFSSTSYSSLYIGNPGRYRELAQCLQKLPSQIEIFTQATGLIPVFSYCRSMELSVGKNWEVIITAPGKPKLKPEFGSFIFFDQPQGIKYEVIFNDLKEALSKAGATLSDLIFHVDSVLGRGEGGVHYFSNSPLHFRIEPVADVPKFEDCAHQVEEVSSFLAGKDKSLFTVYCGDRQFGLHRLHLGFIEKPTIDWQKSVDKFKSFEECSLHKAEVLKNYEGSTLNPLLGGLCSEDYKTSAYHVIIFRQKHRN